MSNFVGLDQETKVLKRLRSEMKKSVLTAAAPRTFDANKDLPTGGGYGLDFTGFDAYLPTTWIDGTHDELCPILEEGRWIDFESGQAIADATAISPFTDGELRDLVDDVGEVLDRGAGFMVISFGDQGASQLYQSGIGRHGKQGVDSPLTIQITVPSGRGRGQATLYGNILSAVLGDSLIYLNDDPAVLRLTTPAPELVPIAESTAAWLTMIWSYPATRIYSAPTALGTP